MTDDQDAVILRAFAHRDGRTLIQLLQHIQDQLGGKTTLVEIFGAADRLGLIIVPMYHLAGKP